MTETPTINLIEALKDSESVCKKDLIDQELRNYATNALNENVRLQQLVTYLEAENHRLTIKVSLKYLCVIFNVFFSRLVMMIE